MKLVSGFLIRIVTTSWLFWGMAVLAEDKVTTLTSGEFAPYTSKELKHGGIFTHIVTEAFAYSGIKTKYEYYPWNRSYKLAREGQFDGSLTWAPTAEREKDFYFSEPVIHIRKVFFHLKSFPFEWKTMDDLKGLRIGATEQYTYSEEFDLAAKEKTILVSFVRADYLNIRKLLAGRIDIFPMEIEVGYTLIQKELTQSQRDLVTHHKLPVQKTPLSVVFSRKLPQERVQMLLYSLNAGLRHLKDTGRYEEMIRSSRTGAYIKH